MTPTRRARSPPRSARLASVLLAALLALALAQPAEAFKWWKWKLAAKAAAAKRDAAKDWPSPEPRAHHHHHAKHHWWMTRDGDGMKCDDCDDCDDCGTWWRAKRWHESGWWARRAKKPRAVAVAASEKKTRWTEKKTADDDDEKDDGSGWVPGRNLGVAKCMLRACRWELKACRKDLACRAAVQCAVDCGLGGDAGSRGCAFQCALDNQNDATQKMFGCVLENECLPAP